VAGSPALGKAIEILDQITLLAGAGVPLIAVGRNLVTLIRSLTSSAPQATPEEAAAAIKRWEAAEKTALDRNAEWLDTHPRI
jgi:hypothetical protein